MTQRAENVEKLNGFLARFREARVAHRVAGQDRPGLAGPFQSTSPVDRSLIRPDARSDAWDVDTAAKAAWDAFPVGHATKALERKKTLVNVAKATEARADIASGKALTQWDVTDEFSGPNARRILCVGVNSPDRTAKDKGGAPQRDEAVAMTRVNAEVRQEDALARMMVPIREEIADISAFTTLEPGDMIATGTPTGAGARFGRPNCLMPGDVTGVEANGIANLRNTVQDKFQEPSA